MFCWRRHPRRAHNPAAGSALQCSPSRDRCRKNAKGLRGAALQFMRFHNRPRRSKGSFMRGFSRLAKITVDVVAGETVTDVATTKFCWSMQSGTVYLLVKKFMRRCHLKRCR
jgi:hypothetical protein